MIMYSTIKRIYNKSYNPQTKEYNTLILDRAVEKRWITTEQREQIIKEVG